MPNLPRHPFSDPEKAQCVIWSLAGHGDTAVQRMFRTKYEKMAPSRPSIVRWVREYRNRGSHAHRGGNGRPAITSNQKAAIRNMFEDNPQISLRFVAG